MPFSRSCRSAFLMISAASLLCGCVARQPKEFIEPAWISEGQSIAFEGGEWHPQRRAEVFSPPDLVKVAEHRGVAVYAEKVDLKPYRTLYTKMGQYEYRVFKRK